jgi:hypothetical protein
VKKGRYFSPIVMSGAVPAAPAWVPTDIAGCKLWLDASQIVGLSDGDPVGTWADASGLGNNFSQSTEASKPAYKINILNGLPSVRSASNDFMTSTASGLIAVPANTNSFTVFMVYKISWGQASTDWNATGVIFGFDSGDATLYTCYAIHASYANSYRRRGGPPIGDSYSLNNNPALDTNPYYSTLAHNGASQLPLLRIRGTNKITAWDQKSSSYTMGTSISRAIITSYVQSSYTELFEIIVYDSFLEDTDRQTVEDYLITKYGL